MVIADDKVARVLEQIVRDEVVNDRLVERSQERHLGQGKGFVHVAVVASVLLCIFGRIK